MNEHETPSQGSSPPPPPAQRQAYYGPPPAERSGAMGGITKLGGVLSLGLLVFLAGFYVAVYVISSDPGPSTAEYRTGTGSQKVAIIPVNGAIDNYTSRFIHEVVEAIIADESVRAVVLRVQSPGGAVTASDEILYSINRLRTERNLPVVASYGDVAASGGYYVSCQADRIFAQPTSITGSIGVIAPAFTVEKLLEKIGVQPEIVTSSLANEKDLGTPLRAWTEEDRERIQGILNSIQEQFISVIVEGRKDVLSADEVRSLATGAIFTAQDALDARLVDEIGYIGTAIDHAVSLADFELEDPPAVIYQPRAGLGALLGAQARTQTSAPTPDRIDASTIRQWANELSVPKLMYMWQQ